MGALIIRGSHVVMPGKDLGATDVIVVGDKIVSVGTSSVGAFSRNAQIGGVSPTAGVVQARLPGSSENCPHGSFAPGCDDSCGSFAPGCDDSCGSFAPGCGDSAAPVGAFLRNAPLESYSPPSPGFYCRFGHPRVWHGDLPHCQQANVATFVTLRAAGSLPQKRLEELREFDERFRGRISPKCAGDPEWSAYIRRRRQMVEKWLDAGEGPRPFEKDGVRRAIEDALRAGCPDSYDLYSFVVMPNHVHVLMQPHDEFVEKCIASFKRFTGRTINRLNGTTGTVWQREHYDTLIRDEVHFRHVRDYICKNDPDRAWDYCRSCAFRRNAPTGEDARISEKCAHGILRGSS